MSTETATYISDLDVTRPFIDDVVKEGYDHLKLIKATLKATFPSINGPVTLTEEEINGTSGVATRVTVLEGNRIRNDTSQSLLGDFNASGILKQAGSALFPSGLILMWYGLTSAIPAGFKLCDGTSGTPDLRDKFVIGVSSTLALGTVVGANALTVTTTTAGGHNHGGTQPAGAHGHSGATDNQGSHSHSGVTGSTGLSVAQMPSHNHTIDFNNRGGGSSGGRYLSGEGGDYVDVRTSSSVGSGAGHDHAIPLDGLHGHNVSVAAVADHSHALASDGTHSHTGTWDNRPASVALVYVMKT